MSPAPLTATQLAMLPPEMLNQLIRAGKAQQAKNKKAAGKQKKHIKAAGNFLQTSLNSFIYAVQQASAKLDAKVEKGQLRFETRYGLSKEKFYGSCASWQNFQKFWTQADQMVKEAAMSVEDGGCNYVPNTTRGLGQTRVASSPVSVGSPNTDMPDAEGPSAGAAAAEASDSDIESDDDSDDDSDNDSDNDSSSSDYEASDNDQ